jgi:hypothetical protein
LRIFALALISLCFGIAVFLPVIHTASAQSVSDALVAVNRAFADVSRAESSGANVTQLVQELNQALLLINQGESIQGSDPSQASSLFQQASAIASTVEEQIPSALVEGQAATRAELFWLGAYLVGISVACVLIYLFGSRVFWTLWLRTHRSWVVRKSAE